MGSSLSALIPCCIAAGKLTLDELEKINKLEEAEFAEMLNRLKDDYRQYDPESRRRIRQLFAVISNDANEDVNE